MARRRFPKGTWMKLASSHTLKALIEQRRYSHEQMARYAGCSRGFISHLTAGRKSSCTPQLAHRIAEALDVPLEVLFVPRISPAGSENTNRPAKRSVA